MDLIKNQDEKASEPLFTKTQLCCKDKSVKLGKIKNKPKTRMHSSRMRTARSLTVSRSICQGARPCHACPPAMHTPHHTCPLAGGGASVYLFLVTLYVQKENKYTHPPATHTPLSCMPPTTHTLPCMPPLPPCHPFPPPHHTHLPMERILDAHF